MQNSSKTLAFKLTKKKRRWIISLLFLSKGRGPGDGSEVHAEGGGPGPLHAG
jgi:hypothetical protein